MAEVQKAALESYNKIKAERGEVTALDMFIAGRDWFKDQMMKDAVDGEVNIWGSHISLPKVLLSEFSKQRVKVIIIKE